MKITVIAVHEIQSDIFIHFRTGAGPGAARWMNKTQPEIDCSYDVEFDTDKTISQVISVSPPIKPVKPITVEGGKVRLTGVLEAIDPDGMAFLRLSPDCLFMIETGDQSYAEGESVFLEFEQSDIQVTAQGHLKLQL